MRKYILSNILRFSCLPILFTIIIKFWYRYDFNIYRINTDFVLSIIFATLIFLTFGTLLGLIQYNRLKKDL